MAGEPRAVRPVRFPPAYGQLGAPDELLRWSSVDGWRLGTPYPLEAVVEKVLVEGVRREEENVEPCMVRGFVVCPELGGAKGKMDDELVRVRLCEKVDEDSDEGCAGSRCTWRQGSGLRRGI